MTSVVLVHVGPKPVGRILVDCLEQLEASQSTECNVYLYIDDMNSLSDMSKLSFKFPFYIVTPDQVPTSPMHTSFLERSTLDSTWNSGYWKLCSQRFFAIHDVAVKFGLQRFFHIETDVLVYWPFSDLCLDSDVEIGLTLLNPVKVIPGIMYFRDADATCKMVQCFLQLAHEGKNDMDVLGHMCQNPTMKIYELPVSPMKSAPDRWSQGQSKLGYIFDGAAIGQWIGGVDKVCKTQGFDLPFVNTEASYRFDNEQVTWDSLHRPHVNGIPVFNLHVHSKQLARWRSTGSDAVQLTPLDIVIPVGPNDIEQIKGVISHCRNIAHRNVYLIAYDPSIVFSGAITVPERIFPFNMSCIAKIFGESSRNGWYLQQLLKLYAGFVIPGILDDYLVIDCDTYMLKPIEFFKNGKYQFNTGTEYHNPYFEHMKQLHPSLTKAHPESGISHHMIFNRKYVRNMFDMIEQHHKNTAPFWLLFLNFVRKDHYLYSGASEYELYFTYMWLYHRDVMEIRKLKWSNSATLESAESDLDYVSVHWYLRKN